MRRVNRLRDGNAHIEKPEACENRRIGSRLGRRSNRARGAVRSGLEVADEVVVTERQQRRRKHVERQNDLQPKARGSAREPCGTAHLHFNYTGRFAGNAKTQFLWRARQLCIPP